VSRPSLFAAVTLFVTALAPLVARADVPDVVIAPQEDQREPVRREWTYLGDPRLPAPLQVVATTRATYTDSGTSPTRPFASNTGVPGGAFEVGGELGVAPHVSLAASGILGEAEAGGAAGRVGALASARFALLPSSWRDSHLTVDVGYLRELTGSNGAWVRAVATQDFGRLRLGGSLHGEHVFAQGRDDVDVMVTTGASVRVAQPLRLGVEYVAQDLEGAVEDEAEGGVRHFLGPTAAISLLGDRLGIVGGPAMGLSPSSPRFVGRVGVAWSF
jgi:hypothetical protein